MSGGPTRLLPVLKLVTPSVKFSHKIKQCNIIIGVLIVLHLLVAVVVEIFRSNLDRSEPTIAAFFQLKELWDMTCSTGRISTVHIDTFVQMVPDMPTLLTGLTFARRAAFVRLIASLQIPNVTGLTFARRAAFVRLIASLQIPMDQQQCVQFNDVIRAFVWRRYKVENRSALLVFQEQRTSNVHKYTVADALAARIIQQMFRSFKQRQRDEQRNRVMAIRRQMMRKRGRYEDVDESYIDISTTGQEGQNTSRQTTSSNKIPEELLNMFAAMANNTKRSEGGMTLLQNISDAIRQHEQSGLVAVQLHKLVADLTKVFM
ncbi:GPI-anchored surface protein, putative [Bodo saltans]|uniref:GPI-anchored surface protein, putative n=1 Tax=Bodo saltans TaxID=75058 RepID=A0A0S4KF92_BODSA|nr:GPI-anchored surface protein, putative [Bodo saltans]|eukprot:CUI11030.1 GPI-anchored surface protein, putative [Bodo saltans]